MEYAVATKGGINCGRRCIVALAGRQSTSSAITVSPSPDRESTGVALAAAISIDAYFDELLLDQRGNRQGFALKVVSELMDLKDYYQRVVYPKAEFSIWEQTDREVSSSRSHFVLGKSGVALV